MGEMVARRGGDGSPHARGNGRGDGAGWGAPPSYASPVKGDGSREGDGFRVRKSWQGGGMGPRMREETGGEGGNGAHGVGGKGGFHGGDGSEGGRGDGFRMREMKRIQGGGFVFFLWWNRMLVRGECWGCGGFPHAWGQRGHS